MNPPPAEHKANVVNAHFAGEREHRKAFGAEADIFCSSEADSRTLPGDWENGRHRVDKYLGY